MNAPNSRAIRFEAYELDLNNRELRRQGILINLQPQAFRILAVLASRHNMLVSREELIGELWPKEPFADLDNRLNFEIKKVRDALRDDADRPRYIETVRKSGYKFVAPVESVQVSESGIRSESGSQKAPQDGATEPVRAANGQIGSNRIARPLPAVAFAWHQLLAGIVMGGVAVLLIWVAWTHERKVSASSVPNPPVDATTKSQPPAPVITAVSPILPKRTQEITVEGRGFGHYTPFHDLDTPFLAVGDDTGHWSAGRITPENSDEVTLTVNTWTDTDIVITCFSGLYGQKGWVLKPGHTMKVRVWNPQTGAGPAEYHLKVSNPAIPAGHHTS